MNAVYGDVQSYTFFDIGTFFDICVIYLGNNSVNIIAGVLAGMVIYLCVNTNVNTKIR